MAQIVASVFGAGPRQRKNIRVLQEDYDAGNKKPLSDYLRAWEHITVKLPPTDLNSFFMIAGYHGSPLRGAGWGNPFWWGGYCNHGNVLFPTWHRAYLFRLENALRTADPSANVALHYWNETEQETLSKGIPRVFLSKQIELDDGRILNNPLYSYTFASPIWDNLSFPQLSNDSVEFVNPNYYKDQGSLTRRFPYSGLQGQSSGDQDKINAYNKQIDGLGSQAADDALNKNVQRWLLTPQGFGTLNKYEKCLQAPNYTVFSNTTSAMHYNEITFNTQGFGPNAGTRSKPDAVVPLESPHNDMHLAVGGFNVGPTDLNDPTQPLFDLANGDMGENETAAFDPIFFHHHCFIDKMFWNWQQLHTGATKSFDIIPEYPGTNSVDNQGPTPGVAGGTWLNMDSPLTPFKKGDKADGPPMTSWDVIDIESSLGYTYVEATTQPDANLGAAPPVQHHMRVTGVNKGQIKGSFVIAAYKKDSEGKEVLLSHEAVLSRWSAAGCANCQNHLNVKTILPLANVSEDEVDKVYPKIITRKSTQSSGPEAVGLGSPGYIPPPAFQIIRPTATTTTALRTAPSA